MIITKAEEADLNDILVLQHIAYLSEAKLLDDFSIPPLKQVFAEIQQEYDKGIILKAVDEKGSIVGSVRAYIENDTAYIGKLIVHPRKQKQGIGTKLLLEIEHLCLAKRYELFTSHISLRNIKIYENLGYQRIKEEVVTDKLTFVYFEKHLESQTI